MEKRVFSLVFIVAMVASMALFMVHPAFAASGATGKYLDEDGVLQDIPEAVAIKSSASLLENWNTVSGKVTINSMLRPSYGVHEVNIVLMDDSELVIHGGIGLYGNTPLNIYSQSTGSAMGKLTVYGETHGETPQDSYANAGIGPIGPLDYVNITINGGFVSAFGGEIGEYGGAGIGTGWDRSNSYSCGDIIINGGCVWAVGAKSAPGIGASSGICGDIIINGGCVVAACSNEGHKAIGGLVSSRCGDVVIAQGNNDYGQHGSTRYINCELLPAAETSSCTECAHPSFYRNDIDGKYYKALPFTQSNFIGNTQAEAAYAIRTADALPHSYICLDGGYHRCTSCDELERHSFDESGKCACGISRTGDKARLFMCIDPDTEESVAYYAPAGLTELTTSGTYGAGWYILRGKQTINGRINFSGDETNGAVHLILADNADVTIKDGIGLDGVSFVIYSQSSGKSKGRLTSISYDDYAGIGSNQDGTCGDIIINGGDIIAGGKSFRGAGIGSGPGGTCGDIVINDGRMTVYGGYQGAGIGSGDHGRCGNITLNGGCVKVQNGEGAQFIGAGANGSCGTVTVVSDCTSYMEDFFEDNFYCINLALVDAAPPTCTKAGHIAYYADIWNREYFTQFSLFSSALIGADSELEAWLAEGGAGSTEPPLGHKDDDEDRLCDRCGAICYYDYDSSAKRMALDAIAPEDLTEITSSTSVLADGWYIVRGSVDITGYLTVDGDVHLILADDAALAVKEGIRINPLKILTIHAQSFGDHMGSLFATGSNRYGGIGGNNQYDGIGSKNGDFNDIIINGGNITAEGGEYGAGIGGSELANPQRITINAGNIVAIGGKGAAGIGGGYAGSCRITINGGTVWAKSGRFVTPGPYREYPAGIGSGAGGSDSKVYINGGYTEVYSGNSGIGAFESSPSVTEVHVGELMSAHRIVNGKVESNQLMIDNGILNSSYNAIAIMSKNQRPNEGDDPINPFNPGEHAHLGILQPGEAATENSAGYKDCYECSCGKFFEDEACTVEIADLDAWKAQGGNGYIAPLSGEKDVPASPQTGDASSIPQTGDASNMALWVVLMLASAMGICVCLIFGKRKRE